MGLDSRLRGAFLRAVRPQRHLLLGPFSTGHAGDVRDPRNAPVARGHLRKDADVSGRVQVARGVRRSAGGAGRYRRLAGAPAQPRPLSGWILQLNIGIEFFSSAPGASIACRDGRPGTQ